MRENEAKSRPMDEKLLRAFETINQLAADVGAVDDELLARFTEIADPDLMELVGQIDHFTMTRALMRLVRAAVSGLISRKGTPVEGERDRSGADEPGEDQDIREREDQNLRTCGR